jgi:phosphopantetheinyl transferase
VKVTDHGPLGHHAACALLGSLPNDRRPLDDKRRSVVARAALIRMVALRTGVDAAAVVVGHDERGRPLLDGSPLHVSIAHGGDFVACAVSRQRVGIDIERTDRPESDDALARRVCTPVERQQLAELPPRLRKRALIRLWVRKEAVAKALGLGFALPFEQLDVTGEVPRIRGTRTRALRVRDLNGGPDDYAVAIATEGRWTRVHAQLVVADLASAMRIAPASRLSSSAGPN